MRFGPTMLTTPLRAEKEIATYSRQHLEENFTDTSMISLQFSLFIDAFGLFRNIYRSIMGFYLIPQFLETKHRNRRKSLLPLTLGPFGANLADAIESLMHIAELDEGIKLQVDNTKVFVCSFISAIIRDMPSQQLLSGCLGPKANMPCRYCLVCAVERANLDFNIIEFGRYSKQTRRDVARINSLRTKSEKEKALRDLGLHNDWRLMDALGTPISFHVFMSILLTFTCFTDAIIPALDTIRSRPIDAAYSEYQGLAKRLFNLIFDDPDILTIEACEEITEVFRTFTFPPGWKRLQSPSRYLNSWRMQELARGVTVLPIILQVWLKKDHIKKEIYFLLIQLAKDYFISDSFSHDTGNFTAVQ